MRAAVYRGPGALAIEDVPTPGAAGPGELLVAVDAAAICGTDASEWTHGPILARPPVVLGHEFVGRVLAAGDGVEGLPVGTRIVSGSGISCGSCRWCREGRTNLCADYETLGLHRDGGLAERVVAPAAICLPVPDAVDDVDAAMAQPLAVAIHAARRGRVGPGTSCVVLGAGGIGAFVVAAAAAAGCGQVVAVDIDADRLARARVLGATSTLDGRVDDVRESVMALTGGEGADTVIEASGAPGNPNMALAAVRRGGDVVLVGLQRGGVPLDLLSITAREIDVHGTLAHVCGTDLPEALRVIGDGVVGGASLGAVIDLEDLLDEGIRPLAEGRATGKIVVRVTR